MQCPNGDGELQAHTTHGEQNLTVIYSTCPDCHGYWMESFAANYIKISHQENSKKTVFFEKNRICPICQISLIRATGDNIPDSVFVYCCPRHHGYFFPAGELEAFKKAQKTKIEYHKLWNLPLASVASVLLAGFITFLVINGFQIQQATTLQAKQYLTSQRVFVAESTRDALVSAFTSIGTTLTLHISGRKHVMATSDHRTHTLRVSAISPGSYTYYFTFTINGKMIRSENFTFVMP